MKKKNPLYVVNQKDNFVEEASGLFDAFIKKFKIEPLLELLQTLMSTLAEQVNSYPMFLAFKQFVDFIVSKISLFTRFAIL